MELLVHGQKFMNPVKILCTLLTASFIAEHRLIVRSSSVDKSLPILTSLFAKAPRKEDTSSSEESSVECRPSKKGSMAEDCQLMHVDFEIYGEVQGVFFRKYTKDEGTKLGLRGFCRNTSSGTVSGGMEGPRPTVDKMKYWLQETGSPSSRITRAVFTNEKLMDDYTFPPGFDIKRTV